MLELSYHRCLVLKEFKNYCHCQLRCNFILYKRKEITYLVYIRKCLAKLDIDRSKKKYLWKKSQGHWKGCFKQRNYTKLSSQFSKKSRATFTLWNENKFCLPTVWTWFLQIQKNYENWLLIFFNLNFGREKVQWK